MSAALHNLHPFRLAFFTADGDQWCDECAADRYGPDVLDPAAQVLDDGHNPVRPVYAFEFDPLDHDTRPTCGGCLKYVGDWWELSTE